MKTHQLARLLAAAVALPSGLLTSACLTPCPYTEVLESTELPLDAAEACEIAQKIQFGYEGYTLSSATCAEVCGDTKYNDCHLGDDYLSAFISANPDGAGGAGAGGGGGGGGAGGGGSGVTCPSSETTFTCQVTEQRGEFHDGCAIPGRRPAGLAEIAADTSAVGHYLAWSAHFEAAAVVAFERLAVELAHLGAPRDLLEDLARAARDEVRHAAVMKRLAERRGAPVAAPVIAPPASRSALDIALENAAEGLVNETFAAAAALFQSRHAEDPEIRAAMARIADDECAHAALAFRIASFLDDHLRPEERERVEARRLQAVHALTLSFEDPAPEVRRQTGAPTRAEALAIHQHMYWTVWGDHGARRPEPPPSADVARFG